jgi:hypothetical protein
MADRCEPDGDADAGEEDLDVGNDLRDEDQVEGTLADDLLPDVQAVRRALLRIPSFGGLA